MKNNLKLNYWKTKDRQIIRIDKMTDDHLKNTINKIDKDWLPRLEKEFENFKLEFNKNTWDCPLPFYDVRDFRPDYERLEYQKELMNLELESRKINEKL